MNYYAVGQALQAVIDATVPLSEAQKGRIYQMCEGMLLARSSSLSWIARRLPQQTNKDSRIQWLHRVLATDYVCQEYVYAAFVKKILALYRPAVLHVVMDRTVWQPHELDLVTLSLNFRGRALPIGWRWMPHGMSDYELQSRLIACCQPLLPKTMPVVFHGDNEFGGIRLMQYLAQLGWDFMLGQSSRNCYRVYPNGSWQTFGDLQVGSHQTTYLQNIEVTKRYGYGLLNGFAFRKPRFGKKSRKQTVIYIVTSLPIASTLKRVGHRRWGIECQFRDMKSSGWQVQKSIIRHAKRREGLLTILNMCYLWSTCLGRWLCKSSQRHLVDAKPKRRLSLFRIGWDWLVNQYRTGQTCPALLRLYH